VPEPFWFLQLTVQHSADSNNNSVVLEWERGRLFDQSIVEVFFKLITTNNNSHNNGSRSNSNIITNNAAAATTITTTEKNINSNNNNDEILCTEVKTFETKKTKPLPLNTIELLKLCSKNLSIGPQAAMRAAEHLYLSGFLSYPRTESTRYANSFDFNEVLTMQKNNDQWGFFAKKLLENGFFFFFFFLNRLERKYYTCLVKFATLF
jgi:DNA topoisomerase-3